MLSLHFGFINSQLRGGASEKKFQFGRARLFRSNSLFLSIAHACGLPCARTARSPRPCGAQADPCPGRWGSRRSCGPRSRRTRTASLRVFGTTISEYLILGNIFQTHSPSCSVSVMPNQNLVIKKSMLKREEIVSCRHFFPPQRGSFPHFFAIGRQSWMVRGSARMAQSRLYKKIETAWYLGNM